MKVCLGGTILNFSTLYIIYLSKILHKLNWPTKREHFNFFYFSLPILYYYFCNFSNRTTHILWIYGPQRFIICILWRSGGQVITVIKMDICILKLLIWKDKKYLFSNCLIFNIICKSVLFLHQLNQNEQPMFIQKWGSLFLLIH